MFRFTLKSVCLSFVVPGVVLGVFALTRPDLWSSHPAEASASTLTYEELHREREAFLKVACLEDIRKIGVLGNTASLDFDTIRKIKLDGRNNLYVLGAVLNGSVGTSGLKKISQGSGHVKDLMGGQLSEYMVVDADVTSQGDVYLLLGKFKVFENWIAHYTADGVLESIVPLHDFLGGYIMADQDGSLWVFGVEKSLASRFGMAQTAEIRNIGRDGKTIATVVKDIPTHETLEGLFVRNRGRVNFVSNTSGKLYDFDKQRLLEISPLPFEKYPAVVKLIITDTVNLEDGTTRWIGLLEGRKGKIFRGFVAVTDANGKVIFQKPMPAAQPYVVALDAEGNLVLRNRDRLEQLEKFAFSVSQ